jgi:DNA-binding transcriptional MerR regulator
VRYAPTVPSTPVEVSNGLRRRPRAVDLARSVGLSVQQVRNYVDQGLLPPVERTPSGYRIFTAQHAEALEVARALIAGHGWQAAREIMQAVHGGDVEAALTLVDRGHAELDRERAHVDRVLGAFESIVTTAPEDGPARRRGLRIGEVADTVGVRTSALRLWERYGLLRPGRERHTRYRTYDEAEFRNANLVALLRKGGYRLDIVRAVIDEMRSSHHRKPERVRAELARREQELHRRSWERLRASALLYAYLERVAVPPPDPRPTSAPPSEPSDQPTDEPTGERASGDGGQTGG